MGAYPIFLELAGRSCVVIGGGPVALRKVEGLLAARASVTVISPSLTAGLRTLSQDGRIRHVAREYAAGDLADHQLAFVATGAREVTESAVGEGRAQGVWVNVADDPDRCDFFLPALLRRGDLVVAVGTGGTSPALSRAVRDELAAHLPDDYSTLAGIIGEVRRELRQRACSLDGETWRRALDGDLRRLVAEGRREEAKARLRARLDSCP